MELYTIGHSNHPIDRFIHLLADHVITRLADVRSTPYSRYNPQFNQAALRQSLLVQGIDYAYLGKELGGRPADLTCYRHHVLPIKASDYLNEVDYAEVMKRSWFIQGIQGLLEYTTEQVTCVLCSERDPAQCHRHHLIASYLLEYHPEVEVRHILADGSEIEAKSLLSKPGEAPASQLSF